MLDSKRWSEVRREETVSKKAVSVEAGLERSPSSRSGPPIMCEEVGAESLL